MLRKRYGSWIHQGGTPLLAAAPAGLLLASRELPPTGFGLWLRLLASTSVLLLPGLVVARKIDVPLISAAVSVSLLVLAFALATVFLFHLSLGVALLVYAFVGAAAASLVGRSTVVARGWRPLGIGGVLGLGLGALLWPVAGALTGDALFHLARVRKLEDFGSLSLSRVDEFRNGGLHPGYAFPLWHGFLAFIARLSGVDPRAVLAHESSLLTVVAVLVAFEAGRAVFGSAMLGAAAALTQVVLTALAPGHGGAYVSLALPATAARQILVPAAIALAFSATKEGAKIYSAQQLPVFLVVAAAGLELALVHITYALFLAVVLAGSLLIRALVDRADARALAISFGFFGAAAVAVLAWLAPLAASTRSHNPTCAEIQRAFANYQGQIIHNSCSSYSLAPGMFARSGSIAVAALLLAPVAAVVIRQRSSSLVLGGTLAILLCTLPAWIFPHFADLVSISQARRAAGFVPLSFALTAGAAVTAARIRQFTLPLALSLGITLQLAYPGSFGTSVSAALPGFPAWIALVGGLLAIVVALATGVRSPRPRVGLALAATTLFAAPVAVAAFLHWTAWQATDRNALTTGLTQALARPALRGSIVYSDPATSYEVAASDPVYIATAPVAHVANTPANNPYGRRDDALRFVATGVLAIPRRYGACTVLLRPAMHLHLSLRALYRDRRFILYALPPVWRNGRCH